MAINLTAWASEIYVDIVGVPVDALKIAVRKACIQFCEKTLLWTYTLDPITIEEDTADYTLTIPAALYAEIICTDNVKYKSDGEDDDQYRRLPPISEALSDLGLDVGASDAWKYETASEPTYHWMDLVDKQLHVWPIPEDESEDGLLVKLCLKPNSTTDTVADFLRRDFTDEIQQGALAYLYGRKNTPWYDPNEQQRQQVFFEYGCNKAKTKVLSGATQRPLQVQMREWI